MPSKLPIRVVHVSGQDEGYPAIELNRHSPTTRGWVSSRFCLYPQDLVVYLEQRSRIRKVQILSHQYLIASKIEFFVGDVPDGVSHNLQNARYSRLGYVALSDNEKTGFRARELKSVHVDAVGVYLKLVIHKNYVNKHNLYNQVGLVAVNLIGDPLYSPMDIVSRPDKAPDDRVFGPDYISPLDDLAFDMYQDREIADVIRKLEARKHDAVLSEQFELAKRLRDAVLQLQRVGEKLGKLEVEKRQAVENEDYERANLKKIQMDEYRLQIYRELDVAGLLAGRAPFDSAPLSMPPAAAARRSSPPPPPLLEPIGARRSPSPPPQSSYRPAVAYSTDYDDRPLPALKHQQTGGSHTPLPEDDDGAGGAGITGEPENLTEKDMREASAVIDMFGLPLVTKAFSKTWSHREDALLDAYKQVNEMSAQDERDPRQVFRAGVYLCQRGVQDKVFSVFRAALSLNKLLLTDFTQRHSIQRHEIQYACDRVLPGLLQKTGDTAPRMRDTSKQYLVEMSQWAHLRPLQAVPHECLKPFKPSAHERLGVGRVDVAAALYRQHGLSDGVTLDGLMTFAVKALDHRHGDVRESAESLIVELYKQQDKAVVRSHLPPDDERTRRNTLYRKLFEAFDRVDGKQPRAAQQQQQEEAQQRQIEELKRQQKELRELAAQQQQAKEKPKQDSAAPPSSRKAKPAGGKAKPANASEQQPPQEQQEQPQQQETPRNIEDEPVPKLAVDDDEACIFCDEKVQGGSTEQGMEVHFWKSCPMLKRCTSCRQVVEIAMLSEHLLNECEHSAEFRKCPYCTEAIPVAEHEQHVRDNLCNHAVEGQSHCPLCHENFPTGDDGWKEHLTGSDGCKQNPRRLIALNRKAEDAGGGGGGNGQSRKSKLPQPRK
ncbi:hypothetical protein BOX15_Mlig022803g1 [Macrostomum lignano]|uniref:Uncharacterized protein n=2 Tax=Macrostomum lignano TaxID=282301 RepID=A0A267DQ22_9PLAT|nr:hypothetical protein BOX15_Mlig022803g2 [Macrostomum lignano]PAA54530.1 hypothetical protein BOX15_Mlig022803g1 [Macrostomum lignano]